MSPSPRLFEDLDEAKLDEVALAIGLAMAAAVGGAAQQFCHDDRISPEVFLAGIRKAHLDGLASAIATGAEAEITPTISLASVYLIETVTAMRGGK